MPYELVSDGQTVDLGDRRYLLSPQDLSGLEVLPDLVRAGVRSLKIEGRLKSAEYVASITRVYRRALDQIAAAAAATAAEQAVGPEAASPTAAEPISEARYELEMAFSRGLHTGWFRGINNQELAHARFGKKRGVFLGEVSAVGPGAVRLRLEGPLKPGDGIGFDAGRPDLPEEGGRVYGVRALRDGFVELTFGSGAVDFQRVQVGNRIWKTDDPVLNRELRKTFEGDAPRQTRPLRFEVHGCAEAPMTLIVRDTEGHVVQVSSSILLMVAQKRPMTVESLGDSRGVWAARLSTSAAWRFISKAHSSCPSANLTACVARPSPSWRSCAPPHASGPCFQRCRDPIRSQPPSNLTAASQSQQPRLRRRQNSSCSCARWRS
jgi:putative protease